MATIPLQIAQRSLDTGSVVQYPGGGEIGRAMQSAGSELTQLADYAQQRQDQMDRFKRVALENEFDQAVANQSDDFARNAPADGAGIHDGIVGQIDPKTGTVIKPGLFDNLADEYRQKMPASQRGYFDAGLGAKRLAVSGSAASTQYAQEQKYATLEVGKIQDGIINSILQMDPNDAKSYDAFKAQGRATIEASPLAPLAKKAALDAWEETTPKALAQAITARDPGKLRAMLGMAPAETKEVAPAAGGAGGASRSGGLLQRGRGIANYFQQKGLSPVAAAGIAGALMQENGGRFDGPAGDNGISHGAAQWNGARFEGLKHFAAARGKDWTDGTTQLDYILWEMENGDPGARRAGRELKAATTVEQAATAMMHFERPKGYSEGNPTAGHAYGNRLRFAQEVAGENPTVGVMAPSADPRFASLSPEDRLSLANADDVAFRQKEAAGRAQANAHYSAYKDAMELGVVQGKVADEGMISNDTILKDGDKATLIRSLRAQNETLNQTQADLASLASGGLTIDPYATKDRTRVDNIYSESLKHVPQAQQGAVTTEIIRQTGVVPQPVVNNIRQGLTSQDPAQVAAAAQTAQRITQLDPAALGRRDGGTEVQRAADDFGHMVNDLNMSPTDAAKRLIDLRDPAKQQTRKALEPAAKEFVKSLADFDLAKQFKTGWLGGTPSLGLTPEQELGIKADFNAIAEDMFYAKNGDPELAKNAALEQMKTLYGVSDLAGDHVLVKHPPEKYWPKQSSENATTAFGLIGIPGTAASPWQYVQTQLYQDVSKLDENFQPGSIRLVTTPETDAAVKRGEMPGYAVLYKDHNGNLQTIPGKLWRPDVTHMLETEKAKAAKRQADAEVAARQKDLQINAGRDREFSQGQDFTKPGTTIYTPERRQQFLKDEATGQKGAPGANIPTDIPSPDQLQPTPGNAM